MQEKNKTKSGVYGLSLSQTVDDPTVLFVVKCAVSEKIVPTVGFANNILGKRGLLSC